jgi:hypothetical protein
MRPGRSRHGPFVAGETRDLAVAEPFVELEGAGRAVEVGAERGLVVTEFGELAQAGADQRGRHATAAPLLPSRDVLGPRSAAADVLGFARVDATADLAHHVVAVPRDLSEIGALGSLGPEPLEVALVLLDVVAVVAERVDVRLPDRPQVVGTDTA